MAEKKKRLKEKRVEEIREMVEKLTQTIKKK